MYDDSDSSDFETIEDEDLGDLEEIKMEPVRTGPKIVRNDPCPCGSGKKYKKCCGIE